MKEVQAVVSPDSLLSGRLVVRWESKFVVVDVEESQVWRSLSVAAVLELPVLAFWPHRAALQVSEQLLAFERSLSRIAESEAASRLLFALSFRAPFVYEQSI